MAKTARTVDGVALKVSGAIAAHDDCCCGPSCEGLGDCSSCNDTYSLTMSGFTDYYSFMNGTYELTRNESELCRWDGNHPFHPNYFVNLLCEPGTPDRWKVRWYNGVTLHKTISNCPSGTYTETYPGSSGVGVVS